MAKSLRVINVELGVEQLISALASVVSMSRSKEERLALASKHVDYALEALSLMISDDHATPLIRSQSLIKQVVMESVKQAITAPGNTLMSTDKLNRRYKLFSNLSRSILLIAIDEEIERAINFARELKVPVSILDKKSGETIIVPHSQPEIMRANIRRSVSIHPQADLLFYV